MDHNHMGDLSTVSSYAISIGLVLGDAMKYMNDYAGAFGVLLGVATFCVNLHYKRMGCK